MKSLKLKIVMPALVAGAIFMFGGIQTASAFTSLDRVAAWSAWTNAFYYTDGNGRGYFRDHEGTGDAAYFWQWAHEIGVVNQAAKVGLASSAMVNASCQGFTNVYGANWSWNEWNDDLIAVSKMFIDAYEITGNPTWRSLSKYGFDLAYSRGYVPSNGGMNEFVCTTNCLEATETANMAMLACYRLGIDLPDSSYITKAQGLYGYMTNYVINRVTGMVSGVPGSSTTTAPGDYGNCMLCAGVFNDTNVLLAMNNYLTNNWGVLLSGGYPGGASGFALWAMGQLGLNTTFANQVCDNAWSWRNSRGLTSQWEYRQNDAVAITCWDAMWVVMGMVTIPPAAPPTLPVSASDVVGSQVIFNAAFPSGWTYQWQKISGGTTNNISGATSMTLTLNNLQLTDTAAYQCRATSGPTVQVSAPGLLTVSSAPSAVSNVIVSCASQTGRGFGCAFTPTWSLISGSVLSGLTPSTAGGNFNLEPYYANRDVNSLTANGSLTITPQAPNYPLPSFSYLTNTAKFRATAATQTLSFIGLDPYGPGPTAGQTVFIDNVKIASLTGTSVTVQDSGFETPSLGAGNHQYNLSGTPWTFSGGGPNGSGIAANGSAFGNNNAPEGTQAALVQGRSSLSQNITGLTSGTDYVITYATAQRPGGIYNNQTWLVTMGDLVTPPGTNAYSYTNYSVTFKATASTQTVAFVGTGLVNVGNTVFIDNVSITSISVPNGGFETPSLGSGNHQYNPTGASWTFGGTCGILANNSAFANPNAPEGVQAAFVQGFGTISQTLSGFTVGNTYTLSFRTAQRKDWNTGGETWNVTVNGAVIGSSAAVVGSRVLTGNNYVTCGNGSGAGSNLIYTLPGLAGYIITNITVYGGWACNEREAQAYKVYYSTVSAPSTFQLLGTVNFNPVNTNYDPLYHLPGTMAATRVTLTPASGVLASNVAAVKFDFTSPASENAYCGYAQIAVFGTSMIAGVHRIVNVQSGKAIDNGSTALGSGDVQWTVNNVNNGLQQKWMFTQNTDTSWNVINQYTSLAMEMESATNGAQAKVWSANGGSNQRWWVDRQTDGNYKIWNQWTSKALENASSTNDGAFIIQWDWNGGNQQRWMLQ